MTSEVFQSTSTHQGVGLVRCHRNVSRIVKIVICISSAMKSLSPANLMTVLSNSVTKSVKTAMAKYVALTFKLLIAMTSDQLSFPRSSHSSHSYMEICHPSCFVATVFALQQLLNRCRNRSLHRLDVEYIDAIVIIFLEIFVHSFLTYNFCVVVYANVCVFSF